MRGRGGLWSQGRGGMWGLVEIFGGCGDLWGLMGGSGGSEALVGGSGDGGGSAVEGLVGALEVVLGFRGSWVL